ncbi:zinc finger MYM-type protein 5-like [Aphis gossypii]|uniref:zinc finger MYM-type protein 5-like n=1 Tax=Aphis gossypii TaxID=80765 RepID=UPI00215990A7|nr:zinc finger MYM-type protein 5-like [Aphis gossypii]
MLVDTKSSSALLSTFKTPISKNTTTAIACYENCHQNVASSSSFELNTDQLKPVHNDEIYMPGTTDHADAVEQCEIGSLEKIQSQENSNYNQILEGHDKDHRAIGNQVLKVGEDTVFNNDPATFCSLKTFPQHFINWILKAGPSQPMADDFIDHKFPTENNRSFHSSWYYKILPSGDKVNRNWLSYSKTTNKIYCIHCILFGRHTKPSWTTNGFNTWSRGTTSIIVHETSEVHLTASIRAMYREASLPILPLIHEKQKQVIAINREIVKHLIDITIFLGRHSLAFRGHREGWKEKLHGNFKDLAILLSKYSPVITTYITELESSGKKRNYLSWNRQNQLIDSIAYFIRSSII